MSNCARHSQRSECVGGGDGGGVGVVGGGRERERGREEGGRERQSITQTNSCRDRVTGTIKLWEARGGIIK